MSQVSKSIFDGFTKALDGERGKPVEVRGEFPILRKGIGKIRQAYVKQYETGKNKGKPFLYIGATCVSPKTNHEGMATEGRLTSQKFDLFDTTWPSGDVTTFEDIAERVTKLLKRIGINTDDIKTGEDLLKVVEALPKANVFFQFSTYESKDRITKKPTGRIIHSWEAPAKDPGLSPEDAVTESDPENSEEALSEDEGDSDEQLSIESDETGLPSDPMELAEMANYDDQTGRDAEKVLVKMAQDVGLDQETIESDMSWEELAELVVVASDNNSSQDDVKNSSEDEDEEEDEEEDDSDDTDNWIPTVGQSYKFKPNKPGTRLALYKITEVDEESETVSLKNGKKSFKNVSWSRLQPAEQ